MKDGQFMTGVVEAIYPHLSTPEIWEGENKGFTVKAKLEGKELKAYQANCDAAIKAAIAGEGNPKCKGKVFKDPYKGGQENENGDFIAKFKTLSTFTNRSGETVKRIVPLFDAKGKRLPEGVEVGMGSRIKINYSLGCYYSNAKMHGVTAYINGIQVIELKQGQGYSAASFGFEEEEGFSVEDSGFAAPDTTDIATTMEYEDCPF